MTQEPIVQNENVNDTNGSILYAAPASIEYDPTVRSCAWCYAMLVPTSSTVEETPPHATVTTCPKCPRLYCSSDCCSMDAATHSFWCGKAGEKGIDFDVLPIAGKGLGLVTLRPFKRGEKILAERPILTTANVTGADNANALLQHLSEDETATEWHIQQLSINGMPTCHNTTSTQKSIDSDQPPISKKLQQINANIRTAAMALTPLHTTLDDSPTNDSVLLKDKINHNGVSVARHPREKAAGLFLTFSRVNHDCVGNSDHYFDHAHGVQLLVANYDIAVGEEITFPYTRTGKHRLQDLQWRGFTCACRACCGSNIDDNDDDDNEEKQSDNDWGFKVNQLYELEQDISALNSKSQDAQRQQAVQSARTMLDLYDELGVSDREYARTHYDLFQILVLREQSLEQAKGHMAKAHDHALRFCGYEQHETVQQFRQYHHHPESHGNYKAIVE